MASIKTVWQKHHVSVAQHINFIPPQNAKNGDPNLLKPCAGKVGAPVEQKALVRGTLGNSFWGPNFGDLGGFSGGNENGQS